MNTVKIGSDGRKNARTTIHSIKSIMVGQQDAATPNSSKRSTQVLVNEGTITSIELTKREGSSAGLEATENNSFTSTAPEGDCSFASGSAADFSEDEISIDPYLDSDLQRQTREFHRLETSNTSSLKEDTELSPDNENDSHANKGVNANKLFKRKTKAPKVITVDSDNKEDCIVHSTPCQPRTILSNSSQSKGGTLHTGDTGPESDLDDDHQLRGTSSTKLKSLGTFEFPETSQGPKQQNIKSLGSGSFHIPEPKQDVAEPPYTSFPLEEPSFIHSPLSAIGRGLKLVSNTLTLPRALFTVEHNQPPSTPVSQASVKKNSRISERMARLQQKADRECDIWNEVVTRRMEAHGKTHPNVAEALLQLGQAYMLAGEYTQAVIAFQSSCLMWKQLKRTDDNSIALARAVDAIGMAWARVPQEEDQDHCHKAMTALEEAFAIRYELLGAWHVDTVETLNKMASVHLHLREYADACNAYWEVFWMRKAIFGPEHPSVAIAAHALGNVFVKLAAKEDGRRFYQIAVDIYDKMALSNKHPAVRRLMSDFKRLDRICLASRVPNSPGTQRKTID